MLLTAVWAFVDRSASAVRRNSCSRWLAVSCLGAAMTALVIAAPGGPVITQQPQSVTVLSGTPVSFSVTASGTPPLTYLWQVDGFNLSDGGVFSGSHSATLNISSASNSAAGQYSVTVTDGNHRFVTSDPATLAVIPPPADQCTSGTIIQSGLVTFFTTEATTGGPDEPGACAESGPAQFSNDVWFRYLAQCVGDVTISLCGPDGGAEFDAKIAVYIGCPAESGVAVACSDNFCGNAPHVTFFNAQQTLYRIRVGGVNGAAGNAAMLVTCTSAPTCAADINRSGAVDIDDLLAVIGAWGNVGRPGSEAGDVNESGAVDIDDLLAVIGAWGEC